MSYSPLHLWNVGPLAIVCSTRWVPCREVREQRKHQLILSFCLSVDGRNCKFDFPHYSQLIRWLSDLCSKPSKEVSLGLWKSGQKWKDQKKKKHKGSVLISICLPIDPILFFGRKKNWASEWLSMRRWPCKERGLWALEFLLNGK